jgi:hypothetical protein
MSSFSVKQKQETIRLEPSCLDLERLICVLENVEDHGGANELDHAGPMKHLARFGVQLGQTRPDPAP